jgi:nitrite reductase/ring-hydroxylating ferredoxin subunit
MAQLCHINEIPDNTAKSFVVDELIFFAVKKESEVFLYLNQCPHLGVELNWQEDQFLDSENALIHCSTHGALFVIESGKCVAGPCMGDSLTPLPFTVVDGFITIKRTIKKGA